MSQSSSQYVKIGQYSPFPTTIILYLNFSNFIATYRISIKHLFYKKGHSHSLAGWTYGLCVIWSKGFTQDGSSYSWLLEFFGNQLFSSPVLHAQELTLAVVLIGVHPGYEGLLASPSNHTLMYSLTDKEAAKAYRSSWCSSGRSLIKETLGSSSYLYVLGKSLHFFRFQFPHLIRVSLRLFLILLFGWCTE